MPYKDTEDGHRITLSEDVLPHARQVFEQGLQLEAILLAHEYLEQKLNRLYNQAEPASQNTIHRKFKQVIDMLASTGLMADEDYEVLNEFNRLRNINSNLILNFSLTLRGAKKGDMIRAMGMADESEQVISRISSELKDKKLRRKKRKKA